MANFPTTVYAPASVSVGQTITAALFNDPYAEITAIEDGLRNGTAPINSSNSTFANLTVSGRSTFAGAVSFGAGIASTVSFASSVTFSGGVTMSGVVQAIIHGRTGGISTGATYFVGLSESLTETDVKIPIPVPGTIKYLFAQTDGAISGANTVVYTLRKNAVDQAVTCTMTGGAISANDSTHSFAVVPGDLVDVKLVTSPGAETRKHFVSYALVQT